MRIRELNISEFGCLKDKRIELGDGLNIINGDNETGKSTIALFIKFMLYGLPKRSSRSRDRERALSFSGHRAEGSMTLELDGKRYRIERRAVAASRVSETVSVVCEDTGEELKGEPWEIFLGVPCEVFESSCLVSQMGASSISKAGAESAMDNMLASADESIDVSAVLDRIDAVRKIYKLNRGEGGVLYEAERRISELGAELRGATEKHLRHNSMVSRLERKKHELEAVESELCAAEMRFEDIRGAQILGRFDGLARTRLRHKQAQDALGAVQGQMGIDGFVPDDSHTAALSSAHTAHAQACERLAQKKRLHTAAISEAGGQDDKASVGERIERAGGKESILSVARGYNGSYRSRRTAGSLLCGVGAVLIPVAALLFAFVAVVAAAIAAVLGVALVSTGVALSVSAKGMRKKRDAACAEYGQTFEQLDGYLSECLEALTLCRQRADQVIAARAQVAAAEEEELRTRRALCDLLSRSCRTVPEEQSELWRIAESEIVRIDGLCRQRAEIRRDIYGLEALIDTEERALSEYDETALREKYSHVDRFDSTAYAEAERAARFGRAKKSMLSNEISELRESIAAYGAGLAKSPADISDEISRTERRLQADTRYFDALMLAKQAIEQASLSMSGNVTPQLSRRAGELLEIVSGGRHKGVQTTKSLDVSVEQDGFNVSDELLSGGTKDAAYLCLRIALMSRLFGGQQPPLMLDETLCQMDDRRAALVLGVLSKLAETGQQTILFSCHARETEICKQNSYSFESFVIE